MFVRFFSVLSPVWRGAGVEAIRYSPITSPSGECSGANNFTARIAGVHRWEGTLVGVVSIMHMSRNKGGGRSYSRPSSARPPAEVRPIVLSKVADEMMPFYACG